MGMDRRVSSEQGFSETALSRPPNKKLHVTGDPGLPSFVQPAKNIPGHSRVAQGSAWRLPATTEADQDLDVASVFAHELAQPLTAIANYIQACGATLAPCKGKVPDRAFECIEKALRESARANQVIERLRTLLDRQELNRASEDINQVVERTCSDLSQVASQHAVKLELQLDRSLTPLMIDAVQIQLVVANLVRNSIDALREVPKSKVSVSTSRTADGGIRVVVTDNGPGLSPGIAGRLFRPVASQKPEGMGIGLSICHAIISAHGGRFSVNSTPGQGTEFHVIFPRGGAVDGQVDNHCRR